MFEFFVLKKKSKNKTKQKTNNIVLHHFRTVLDAVSAEHKPPSPESLAALVEPFARYYALAGNNLFVVLNFYHSNLRICYY